MSDVRVLVLTGYGLNCDHETAYAFELAGASAERVHINSLINGEADLDEYQIFALVGGFSWGDDHGAGVVESVRLRTRIGNTLIDFIDRGKLVIGICNGFQTLVNLGLLPGFGGDYTQRSVALTYNDCGNFRDQWVTLRVDPESPCVFTRGIDRMDLPVRHGEGKFYASQATIDRLVENNQVVIRYAQADGTPADGKFPMNPNGALADIAGICDPSGRVFGLMPHPEAYLHVTNHPLWTRRKSKNRCRSHRIDTAATDGVKLFENAVAYIKAT